MRTTESECQRWLDKPAHSRTVHGVRFATRPENRTRLLWSTTIAVLVSVTAGLGLVLTSGDSASVTAATPATGVQPEAVDTTAVAAPTTPGSTVPDTDTMTATTTAAVPGTATTTTAAPGVPATVAPEIVATTTLPAATTLTAGSPSAEVAELQRQLNAVTGSTLAVDGLYGAGTTAAVKNFQAMIGIAVTGAADPVTRWMLAEESVKPALNGLVNIGAGGANGCQVAVVGDSLMAGAEALTVSVLSRVGCAAAVDGEGGRSLAYGWQCRVERDGRRPLMLYDARIPGNETCVPSGLTLLKSWADAAALGDVVVVALGTNDSGLFEKARWQSNWTEALRLAGGRPVVFLTTQARVGSDQYARQTSYSSALRQWCGAQRPCVVAEWANTAAANDSTSYVDAVHINLTATRARGAFIAEVVAALLTGRPIPNPQPPPTPAIPPAVTTTTVAVTTDPTSTTPAAADPSTTLPDPATTSTTAPATPPEPTTTVAAPPDPGD